MANFWLWFFAVILSLIVGSLMIFLFWSGLVLLKDLWIKRGIPSKRPRVADYIKENPEKFDKTNPGKALENDIKEVHEDERNRNAKYREFEKLRREELKGRNPGERQPNNSTQGSEQPARRELLQNKPTSIPNSNLTGNKPAKRSVKLDD